MKICIQMTMLTLWVGFYNVTRMAEKKQERVSKPKKKNIELLNKFLKTYIKTKK